MRTVRGVYLFDTTIKRKNLLVVFLLLFGFIASSQKISQKFTHYGKQDGLNQSSVNFIYQDSQDYVWVANFGGVNRFDGYSFKSYVNEFDDPNSISDNSVWVITEDTENILWFGTKTGLSQYNRRQNNFTNYFIRENDNVSGTLAVKALFQDKKGRFYVGSEGEGLFLFSRENETFYPVNQIPSNAKVSAITEDVLGNLWVSTENLGLFKIFSDRSSVISFIQEKSFMSEVVWSLFSDQKGNTWIGTDTDGLVQYNSKKDQFIFYKNLGNTYHYQAGDKIKTINPGHDDQIWIGSATKGLSYFSYKEDRFFSYVKNPYDSNSLFDNDVSSICAGSNQVLYVGFYMKGFDKVISTPFLTIKADANNGNTLSDNNVYCMYIDSDDTLWFGTFGGGLNKFDPKTKQFQHFRYDENDPTSISHDWIRIIYEDANGTMWIGTWGGGLNKFDKKTETFKRYTSKSDKKNTLNHNIITALFEDSDQELWIGTYGGGINIYQPETDDFRSVVHDPNNEKSLSDDHITSFYQDENRLLWICTYGGGINAYDKNTNTFERFLPNTEESYSLNTHKTLHVYREPDKDFFWITTLGGGINKFYYKEKKFLSYTESDGLSNNSTMGMLSDDQNTYWISTNNGLSHFDPVRETFINYTINDGLASDDYNLEAFAKGKDGTLYFGGKNGVTYFNPKNVSAVKEFPKVAFTNLKVEDSVYDFVPSEIKIPFKKRISFQYVAVNPDKTNNINYAYQLIGLDDQWRTIDSNRYLEFANLDPGKYELRIRSTNGDKIWNDNYSSISLYVTPPWYMTWYFRIGAVLAVLMSIFGYYRIKINQVKRQNKILEDKVEKRTKTIKEKNVALEIEKDKTEQAYKQLKKLERHKDEFTSMLAHDLKNPLVTILGYSSDHLSNDRLQSINKSGQTMLTLIQNMLEVQKFESTDMKIDTVQNNLRCLVTEAVNQVEILTREKRIKIDLSAIHAEYNVKADKEMIERVLVNLLTNAIKFSPTDSKIEISAQVKEEKPDLVIVCVKDYGNGIPKNRLGAIFSKFSQVEARDSGGSRSTGLGLTFCRMAIEAHQGSIWVESEIDKGSSFFFSLPKLEDSVVGAVSENIETDKNAYQNPLYSLQLEAKDLDLLYPFKEKINTLTLYEMGEWLSIFDELAQNETENVKRWCEMMMEALTNFDENAFSYLKKIIVNIYIE